MFFHKLQSSGGRPNEETCVREAFVRRIHNFQDQSIQRRMESVTKLMNNIAQAFGCTSLDDLLQKVICDGLYPNPRQVNIVIAGDDLWSS